MPWHSLYLIIITYTFCYGKDFFVVDSQYLSVNHTCLRQGQIFQPCNTLEDYSRNFSINNERNITFYLLDKKYLISENSNVYLTAPLVKIRPWNNNSLVTIYCKNYSIFFEIRNIETLRINSVQFLHCGRSGHPLVRIAQGNISLQGMSKIEITNCIFAESPATIFSINSIIFNTVFRNVSFIRNNGTSLLFNAFKSNLIISNCEFVNNTSQNSQSLIELTSLNSVTITSSYFIGNSPRGAMVMTVNNVQISNSIFHKNKAQLGGALYVSGQLLSIKVTASIFSENIATESGGAMYINSQFLVINGTNFMKNRAGTNGGSLFLYGISQTKVTYCLFELNQVHSGEGGAIRIHIHNSHLSRINTSNCKFIRNRAENGGAIRGFGLQGMLTFYGCYFVNNHARIDGGGLSLVASRMYVVSSSWINNTAVRNGGAIQAFGDFLNVTSSDFLNNEAGSGGSLWTENMPIHLWLTNFTQNRAITGDGGAILHSHHGSITLTSSWFVKNVALLGDGGALKIIGKELTDYQSYFIGNLARSGGAIDVVLPLIYMNNSKFTTNQAEASGGAVRATNVSNMVVTYCVYYLNLANSGAGLELANVETSVIYNSNFTENIANTGGTLAQTTGRVGGAIKMATTNLIMLSTVLVNNEATEGGAMQIDETSKVLIGYSNFSHNKGQLTGGAISITKAYTIGTTNFKFNPELQTHRCNYSNYKSADLLNSFQKCSSSNSTNLVTLNHQCMLALDKVFRQVLNLIIMKSTFSNNNSSEGGAISIHGYHDIMRVPDSSMKCTEAIISNCVYQDNCAQQGGAIYSYLSSLAIENTTFLRNEANFKGGGIFIELSLTYLSEYNNFTDNTARDEGGAIHIEFIPWDCRENSCPIAWKKKSTLHFKNNTATTGPILYGGMLDRCDRLPDNFLTTSLDYDVISYDITSQGVRFCLCSACEMREINKSLHPGQSFNLNLACVDQLEQPLNNCVATSDYTTKIDVQLGPGEYRREIIGCQSLTFHAFSHQTGVARLNIEGSIVCNGPLWNVLAVHIQIDACPLGFQLHNRECSCDERLTYSFKDSVCDINNGTILLPSNGWLSYQGRFLRIHPNCPLNYCFQETRHITPTEPDSQCAYHRGGVLCGGCMANYSVVLGSWKCMNCSHLSRYNYIWLTFLLALAGVALVALLLLLKMTVSSGTTNGLIFYANILSFSGLLDYRTCPINPFLRAFLSWINLDLGVEVCYYSGMDVYQKTWLQFVFPFYIWFLVAIIILFCHYSSRVMRLMGTRNIEVLATLFLLSYAKLLKTIVTAFSFTDIKIAQADNVSDPLVPTRVWVYDGSIEYLGNKHTPLFIISLLFLLVLFLPYTLLLSVGHYLYLMPNKKYFKIFHSTMLTTVMDAYHAPYSKWFRFWTGLCLLIRCFLFTVFAVSHSVETNVFWTSVSVIFLFIVRIITKSQVYRKKLVDLLEVVMLLNLLMLMTAFHRDYFCRVLTASISLSALILGFIVIVHIWQEIKKYKLFNKFNSTIDTVKEAQLKAPVNQVPVSANDAKPSVSYVELRETLIET